MLHASKKNKHTPPVADKAPGDWSPRPFRRSDPVSPSPSPPLIRIGSLPMMSSNFDTIPEDSLISSNCDVQKEPDWAAGVKGLEKEIARLKKIVTTISSNQLLLDETRVMIDIHQNELVKWRKNIPPA